MSPDHLDSDACAHTHLHDLGVEIRIGRHEDILAVGRKTRAGAVDRAARGHPRGGSERGGDRPGEERALRGQHESCHDAEGMQFCAVGEYMRARNLALV